MTDDTFHSVLRRKAGAGRARLRSATLTPEKAMVQALSKAAQDLMNLPLRVEENAAAVLSLAELPEHLPERALLALLNGPKDALGLISLDPGLLTGLLEMQTLGRLGTAPVQPRRPTRTDAAMCSPFMDRFLALLAAELSVGDPQDNWAAGYRYASFQEDARPLGLILEDQAYRCFRLTIEIGAGTTRSGSLFLALPGDEGLDRPEAVADPAEEARWEQALAQTVLEAPASLGTILHRMVLPLGQAVTLAPGTELRLPRSVLESVDLTDETGRLLARGRLGQAEGNRALCLTTPEAAAAPAPAAATAEMVPDAPIGVGGTHGAGPIAPEALAVGF